MIGLHDGKGSAAKKPVEKVFSLRLQVTGCTPRIWRRLLVRESMWVTRLHDCIQIAFDWFDYQTHAFVLDNLRFGNPLQAACADPVHTLFVLLDLLERDPNPIRKFSL